MPNKHPESIVLITNPNSTRSATVEQAVTQPLQAYVDEHSLDFTHIQTKFRSAEDNVKDLMDRLPDEAHVLSAAGDGTAEQLVNAALRSEKDLTLGLLPYGNFNDMASAHMDKKQTVLDVLHAPTTELRPMTVAVNGEYWRHAPAYVTLGLTARIAAGFDSPESRKVMKAASRPERVVRRLSQAVSDYFRYSQQALPAFRINDGEVVTDSTDVAASNNEVAAGMIRAQDTYYGDPYFGARADLNMGNIFEAASFGALSLAGHSPLERTEALRLSFEKASDIPIQTGGEFQQLHNVHEIFVYKNPKDILKVLHPKLT